MSKKEKPGYTPGSFMADTLMDPANPRHKPDDMDYSFLSEEPDFSIHKHATLLRKLLKVLKAFTFKTKVLDKDTAVHLAKRLTTALGLPSHRCVLVEDSLLPRFQARRVGSDLLFDIALILAGNREILENNQVIVSSYDLRWPVWVPMTVRDIRDDPNGGPNKRVMFYADAGLFAGSTITKYMTPKFVRFVLSQIGGGVRRKLDVRDLFGTKMSILLSKGSRGPEMEEFSVSSSQESYNKKLFKVRTGPRPCHNGMDELCRDCVLGADRCDYAVYKDTDPEWLAGLIKGDDADEIQRT